MLSAPAAPWPPQSGDAVFLVAVDALGEARGLAAIAAAGAAAIGPHRPADAGTGRLPPAILIELADAEAPGEADLLAEVAAAVDAGRAGAVIACPPAALDRVAAALLDGAAEILVDAGAAERAAAVAVMLAHTRSGGGVREDPPQGDDAERRLAEEAARIARALAGAAAPGWSPPAEAAAAPPENAPLAAEDRLRHLRRLVRERQLRHGIFPPDLFADPAWDMLLDLAIARETGARIAVSSLCIAAGVPTTTAIRWIKTMVAAGMFVRADDPADGRRSFVLLTPAAAAAMDAYLARL